MSKQSDRLLKREATSKSSKEGLLSDNRCSPSEGIFIACPEQRLMVALCQRATTNKPLDNNKKNGTKTGRGIRLKYTHRWVNLVNLYCQRGDSPHSFQQRRVP